MKNEEIKEMGLGKIIIVIMVITIYKIQYIH